MVVKRAIHLAKLNNLSNKDTSVIVDLSYVHDIGKITGTANPAASVELLLLLERLFVASDLVRMLSSFDLSRLLIFLCFKIGSWMILGKF